MDQEVDCNTCGRTVIYRNKPATLALSGALLRASALSVATAEIGNGETGANNTGPDIRRYCAPSGDGHEWCAAFAGYCYEQAAKRLEVQLPFARSLGAKRLTKNLAGVKGAIKFTDPKLALPGDLVCWSRGLPGSWTGHVGVVESVDPSGLIHTIEGNVGKAPAKVKRLIHDVSKERLYCFAGLR